MKLSIIIPLYNESKNILTLLTKLLDLKYPDYISDFELIIINDASTDNSYYIVSDFMKSTDKIQFIQHETNRGKGASIKTGLSYATGDLFLFQDADLELDPNDIPRMLEIMDYLKVEFVNGSRYMHGICRPLSSYWRYAANKLFTIFASILINVKITDMACGYKLIHRNLLQKLTLHENRFGFEAEIMLKALRIKKNNIVEVPVQYFPRMANEDKKLKNKDAFVILWKIVKYGLLRMN